MRRAGTFGALAALTAVLTGCAVGPDYKRPAVTAPEQVRGADVARAYFALRELDARLEIARRTTDAFRETLDLFSRQLAGGIASQLEVSRAEGAMRNAAGAVSDLERQIVAQENLIGFLLGRNPGEITRGASLTGQALVPEIPAGLPSALLERRPDIRQAEQQLVAANA